MPQRNRPAHSSATCGPTEFVNTDGGIRKMASATAPSRGARMARRYQRSLSNVRMNVTRYSDSGITQKNGITARSWQIVFVTASSMTDGSAASATQRSLLRSARERRTGSGVARRWPRRRWGTVATTGGLPRPRRPPIRCSNPGVDASATGAVSARRSRRLVQSETSGVGCRVCGIGARLRVGEAVWRRRCGPCRRRTRCTAPANAT